MKDILGKAILDYHNGDRNAKLWVYDHLGPRVEMKRSVYFRTWDTMPKLEQIAIQKCEGSILDVGAGAGAHSLALQAFKKDVTALDISPLNCQVMRERNIQNVTNCDFFSYNERSFDTILLLMNGVGISGKLSGFNRLLQHCSSLLNENGTIFLDSCDLNYMYEDGLEKPTDRYYGEIDCNYGYKDEMSEKFTWLYLDFETMRKMCLQKGWSCEQIYNDGNDQFLVTIKRIR